jgi:hypothetical protein
MSATKKAEVDAVAKSAWAHALTCIRLGDEVLPPDATFKTRRSNDPRVFASLVQCAARANNVGAMRALVAEMNAAGKPLPLECDMRVTYETTELPADKAVAFCNIACCMLALSERRASVSLDDCAALLVYIRAWSKAQTASYAEAQNAESHLTAVYAYAHASQDARAYAPLACLDVFLIEAFGQAGVDFARTTMSPQKCDDDDDDDDDTTLEQRRAINERNACLRRLVA